MKKIQFESSDEIEFMRETINQILEALGHPEAFVTDLSAIDHFSDMMEGFKPEYLAELEKNLGVVVKNEDLLVDVARRMRGLA